MDEKMDWAEAARYLAGESSEGERAHFEAWIAANPARAELIESLRPLMGRQNAPAAAVDVESAWQKLDARTREPVLRVVPGVGPRNRFLQMSFARAIAASLLVAAGVGAWMLVRAPETPAVETRFATRSGERRSFTLDARTRVFLAPATTMIVTTRNGSARSVQLSGEGYFTVLHDEDKPFSVYTSGAVIRDIGTKFSVRALPGSARTEVIVTDGAVHMRSTVAGADTTGLVVRAGESASSDDPRVARLSAAEMERSLGWVRGELSFVDAPLTQVASELERWYGVPIRIEGSELRSRTLTVTFAGESLDQALAAIARTLGVRYERGKPGGAAVIRSR